MSYNDSWGKILNRHLQTRCKICPDGTGEFADITCGDAWHGDEKGYPSFGELDGRSAILVRTKDGERLLHEAIDTGYVQCEQQKYTLHDLSEMQPYQVNRRQMLIPRSIAFLLFRRKRVRASVSFNVLKHVGVTRALREFLGTIKRLFVNGL